MLTLRFIRGNLAYCLLAIGGLCLLLTGNLLVSLGVADIFRDAPDPANDAPLGSLLASRALAAQFYAALFVSMVFVCFLARTLPIADAAADWWAAIRRAAVIHLAFLPIPLPILLSALVASGQGHWRDGVAAATGFVLAQIPIFVFHVAVVKELASSGRPAAGDRHRSERRRRTVVLLTLLALLLSCIGLLFGPLTPADAFFAIFGWITFVYLLLFYAPGGVVLGVLGSLLAARLAAAALTPADRLRPYQVPGLEVSEGESYYRNGRQAQLTGPGLWQPRACDGVAAGASGCRRRAPEQLLESWRTARGLRRPRIVVVAASGGAYRATFWAAHMLDHLMEQSGRGASLDGLADHVRLVTGASGGMVGATYFAVCGGTEGRQGPWSLARIIERDVLEPAGTSRCEPLEREASAPIDSLLPVADHFARRDLLEVLVPRPAGIDRGIVLERQWRSIAVTFDRMLELQEREHRPALIFSPTIAETGTPLEIGSLTAGAGPAALSRSNLFDAFPNAHRSLLLSTAARLSATFPVITPAARLPTLPEPLHVVDAGYFDNDGIDSAAAYLRREEVLSWLSRHSSGVVLIALRAFPAERGAAPFRSERCPAPAEPGPSPEGGVAALAGDAWLSVKEALPDVPAPLRAVMEVRIAAAQVRTSTTVAHVAAVLKARGVAFDFVTFENSTSVNMSWYLKRSELRCLRDAVNAPENLAKLAQLQAIWSGYLASRSAPRSP
jgi:hypothetical protein